MSIGDREMRIAVVANTSWYLFNFRLNLIRVLNSHGHHITAIGSLDNYAKAIKDAGYDHEAIALSGDAINPIHELSIVLTLMKIFRKIDCALVLSFTPKGNIYSGLACLLQDLYQIPNISGLGSVFISRSPLTYVTRFLYWIVLRKAPLVFFQNEDDRRLFVRECLVRYEKTQRIPGSGVDLNRFHPLPRNASDDLWSLRFLFSGRLLWDKGVGEYVRAARLLRARYPKVMFYLLGFLGAQNPSAISRSQILKWESEGIITYLGVTDDIRPYYAIADCVVLPSYREGVPRTLLEAAAMELPVITTDAIGCRDAVEDGRTGFICKMRDAVDLADKMERMILLSPEQRTAMGKAGRMKMEREFDERIVIDHYLRAIEAISRTR